ncbi:MAG: 2Fe-2S iron-sulfur cluster-binding protein, partial [Proteobacteria bacterium]|nr:2Fe-2S iron-sulfur cluster-binding protein [Pseudomonadota bacterium]
MTEQPNRWTSGGAIDREKRISFEFDGRRMSGFAGDTLASALLANGVRVVGRSFKYHRPRGIFAAGGEEPNALIGLRQGARHEPNLKATQIELFDGLTAASQNRFPSLALDIGAINNLLSPFLPAGFYYKTFMWPASWWMLYEKLIRNAAGLGKAGTAPDPDVYARRYAYCDVLVIGGGPAGMAATSAAMAGGGRTILIDENPEIGGSALGIGRTPASVTALDWMANTRQSLAASNVRVLTRTTAFGYYDDNMILAIERLTDHLPAAPEGKPRQRMWWIRAKQV